MKGVALLASLTIALGGIAQTAPEHYWVQFTDKNDSPFSLSQPEEYLSDRAISRRDRYGISIEESDLPVNPQYVDSLLNSGSITLLHSSKWFNAVTIHSTDTLALDTLENLSFIGSMRAVESIKGSKDLPIGKFGYTEKCDLSTYHSNKYGESYPQILMHNGHALHDRGNEGQGMLIGILDSGFDRVDSLEAFVHLFENDQIKATFDFVDIEENVYNDHSHGMSVLSTLGGILERHLVGTAPKADYVLLRTEDAGSEFIIEEDNWVAGAEYADSAGCDILNTSLGYTTFEDSTQDHSYAELDGMTTRISIAAGIAAEKGMIPVNSAGNYGQGEWFHIGAPADGIGVLTVGAVNSERQAAAWSSRGPSADGRVKPDVMAVGWGAVGAGFDNKPQYINGTSFSSPILAGLVACIWQDNLDHPGHEVIRAIQLSAHQYEMPDDTMGYGIPDMYAAWNLLKGRNLIDARGGQMINVYPNPFTSHFNIEFFNEKAQELNFELFDAMGRKVWNQKVNVPEDRLCISRVEDNVVQNLVPGFYIMQVTAGNDEFTFRIEKIR